MNWLKNGLVIALLVGVGYGVYLVVNNSGDDPPPPDVDPEQPKMSVEMGTPSDPASVAASGPSTSAPTSPSAVDRHAADQNAAGRMDGDRTTAGPSPLFAAAGKTAAGREIDSQGFDRGAARAAGAPGKPSDLYPRTDAPDTVPDAPRPGRATLASGAKPLDDTDLPRRGPDDPYVNRLPKSGERNVARGAGKFDADWQSAQRLLSDRRLDEALALLSRSYGSSTLSAQQDRQLSELLGQLAGTIIYDASTEYSLAPPYVVKSGETLEQIAQANKVPWQLLAKINRIKDPRAVRARDELKVVRGPFDAVVNLGREEVTLLLDGSYAGRFPIRRVGRDFSFPQQGAALSVREKSNRAGECWLGLGGRIGIHGDVAADSRSDKASAPDSIVLAPKDAQELYDILSEQSMVEVRR